MENKPRVVKMGGRWIASFRPFGACCGIMKQCASWSDCIEEALKLAGTLKLG